MSDKEEENYRSDQEEEEENQSEDEEEEEEEEEDQSSSDEQSEEEEEEEETGNEKNNKKTSLSTKKSNKKIGPLKTPISKIKPKITHAPSTGGQDALKRLFATPSSKNSTNASILKKSPLPSLGVIRTTMLPMLTVLGDEDCVPKLRQQFKLPGGLELTAEDFQLAKTKTLGGRRIFSSGLKPARKIEMINIIGDENQEEYKHVIKEDKEDYSGVEPLILWESTETVNPPPPIVVEMFLCKFLRPHQRDGVRFMAECVTGTRDFDGSGVILADDMGLGKTLQSVALLYTLLRQGITHDKVPLVRRAIIVCPTSLVANWANELKKWCGDRIKCIALSESSRDKVICGMDDFLSTRREFPVLIVSYETFRLHVEKFDRDDACDLLIADEAHRLKNAETLTYTALSNLRCKRRVLLSGTPMQNNLEEFFAMVDLINPGVLGDEKSFRKIYQGPILAGREPDATENEIKLANERSVQLSLLVNKFVLRRTNTLLSKHLPPKLVEVVCCKPSPLQTTLYDHFLKSKAVKQIISESEFDTSSGGVQVLPLITALKKLCNHPRLIYDECKAKGKKSNAIFDGIEDFFPADYHKRSHYIFQPELSGKMDVLDKLLNTVRHTTDDRWVLISNFTQTLDLFAELCRMRGWPFVRLDGSTSVKKRQKLVDQLSNRSIDTYIFLLSSKAGGCGLNLIGANRLVLFDPDWNPAVDKQAAARVWRDGQKKRCFVYRFLTTGTIEEKVYQRQLSKEGLQSVIGAGTTEQTDVSTEDLRDLFSLRDDTISDTHDTLDCKCLEKAINVVESTDDGTMILKDPSKSQVEEPREEDLENWAHHASVDSVDDEAFRVSHPKTLNIDSNFVSFIFTCHVTGMLAPEASKPKARPSSNSLSSSRSILPSRAPLSTSASFARNPLSNLSLQPTPIKSVLSAIPKPISLAPTLTTPAPISKAIVVEKPKSKSPPKIIMTTIKSFENKENLSSSNDSLPHSNLMNLTCDDDKPKLKSRLLKKSKPNEPITLKTQTSDFVDLIELD